MGLFPRTHFPRVMNCSEKPGLKWAVGMTSAHSGERPWFCHSAGADMTTEALLMGTEWFTECRVL